MRNVASAYWIDTKSKILGNSTDTLQGILQDSLSKGAPLVTVILYDLPNRDCNARASNGEICCSYNADRTCDYSAAGDCAAGLNEYETTYVNPFAQVLAQFDGRVPIVVIVEPDSLPNLATNQGNPSCGNSATVAAYTKGISYAVTTIKAKAPHASVYLDAAHGGWLGWDNNLVAYADLVAQLGVAPLLRGFSTNVANYQPVGSMCPWSSTSSPTRNDYCLNGQHQSDACCADPCQLEAQWNPCNNELNYAQSLYRTMSATIPGFAPAMVIDTGRSGVASMRSSCSNWCNIRGAGVGLLPSSVTNASFVDAFFWLKTPGESDGCTQIRPFMCVYGQHRKPGERAARTRGGGVV